MGAGRAIAILIGLIGLAATQLEHLLVATCIVPLLAGLLAIALDRESGRLSQAFVRGAARLLPARDREEFRDEWVDHVASAGEHGVVPFTRALSIVLLGVPLLAVGLRVGRRRARGRVRG